MNSKKGWETRRNRGWKNPLKRSESRRHRVLQEKYGLSPEESEKQLAKVKCDCCGRPFEEETPHIDHDHVTGKFRGMVHQQCNVAIGMLKDCPGRMAMAAKYVDPFYRESRDSGNRYLDLLGAIAAEDAAGLKKAGESYGSSWKKSGGVNAYCMLKRKWDRIIQQCEKPEISLDIFRAAFHDKRSEGIIDDIRDLRRYLLLVEAELRARGTESATSTHRDNK